MTNEAATESPYYTQPTEDDAEMRKVAEVFDKARNAIIDSSRLAKEVAELRAVVESFKRDLEGLRERNATLDEALANTRRQRDDAQTENVQLRSDLSIANAKITNLQFDLEASHTELKRTRNDVVEGVQRINDLVELSEALEKERDELRAKLELIEGVLHPQASTTVQPHPHPQPVQELSDFDKSGYNEVREDNQPF